MSILTLDTGYNLGWVLWTNQHPVKTGVITPELASKGRFFWKEKCNSVAEKFALLVRQHRPNLVLAEYPQFYESQKGHKAARQGDLGTLMYITGLVGGVCIAQGIPFQPVPVQEWKGQLSKAAIDARIAVVLGKEYPEHVSDAVGIGLWHFKKINQEMR